jgi:uracil-DNA glycosylase
MSVETTGTASRSKHGLLESHRAALSACRRCGHGDQVLPILSLAKRPRVLLVGQAPGQTETVDQRPFAGRAGKTLFRWLAQAGVGEATARKHIYIAAVTRCYPGPSPSGRGDRVPSREEQAHCREWLDAELRIIRPRLIIPVGKLAIDLFLPAASLDETVGQAFDVAHIGGRSTVVPLPHPSGASSWIHTGDHPKLLKHALRLLTSHLASAGIPLEQTAA